MRNIKYILQDLREATENQDVSSFIGISDRELLRILNEGQQKLQAEIVKKSPKIFTSEMTYNIDGSKRYDIPYNCFLGNKITDVKYKQSATGSMEYKLHQDYVTNNEYTGRGYPETYIRQNGQLIIQPQPTTGQMRVTYVKRVPKLDLQRAVVGAVTLDNSAKTITSLQADILTQEFDTASLNRDEFLTVVDSLGRIKMANVRFTNLSTLDGTISIHPSHVFEEGETIEVGDVIVSGKYSSTHSEFDEAIERYLQAYAELIVYKRDGSSEVNMQLEIVGSMQNEIVDSYAQITDDILHIPDLNEDWDGI